MNLFKKFMLSVIVSASFAAPAKAVVVINLPSLEALLMQILGENVKEVKNMLDQIKELKNQLAQLTKLNDQLLQANTTLGQAGTPNYNPTWFQSYNKLLESNKNKPGKGHGFSPEGQAIVDDLFLEEGDQSGAGLDAARDNRAKYFEVLLQTILDDLTREKGILLADYVELERTIIPAMQKAKSSRDDQIVTNMLLIFQAKNTLVMRNDLMKLIELQTQGYLQQMPVSFKNTVKIDNTNK